MTFQTLPNESHRFLALPRPVYRRPRQRWFDEFNSPMQHFYHFALVHTLFQFDSKGPFPAIRANLADPF